MKALYEYYRGQTLLPTFANLQGAQDVERYAAARAAVLRDRAGLLPAVFNGAEILEFGPDSGENALVFALWGAQLTLVEPNERAHATIRDYFDRFGRGASLRDISSCDVLTYAGERRYDLVVAEGFIYTVKPTRAWLEAFHRVLHPGGLFLVTYYERSGALFELALRALHAMHRRRAGLDATTSARRLYRAKWDSIPHTRAFDSWVMDVLENPFLRASTFIDARSFVDGCTETGFDLYATHPHYTDPLTMDWHKRVPAVDERAERAHAHLERSTLSLLAGRKLYIGDRARAAEIAAQASRLIDDVDALVEADDTRCCARVVAGLEDLAACAGDSALVADGDDRRAAAAAFLSFAQAFRCAGNGDVAALTAHTESDRAFIETWGLPVHVAVGRALPS